MRPVPTRREDVEDAQADGVPISGGACFLGIPRSEEGAQFFRLYRFLRPIYEVAAFQ